MSLPRHRRKTNVVLVFEGYESFHGARMGRCNMRLISSSVLRSAAGSQVNLHFRSCVMLPRMQRLAVLWPTSTGSIGSFRLLTASRKLRT